MTITVANMDEEYSSNGEHHISVCSPIELYDLVPGQSSAATSISQLSEQNPLRIFYGKGPIYSDESVTIKIQGPAGNRIGQVGCPEILLEVDNTVFTPVKPNNIPVPVLPCSPYGQGFRAPGPWSVSDPLTFTISGETLKLLKSIDWQFLDERGNRGMLVAPVHAEVLSPKTLQKHWGRNAGLAVSMSVDRETYAIDDKIWCHVDWINESASKRIGIDEMGTQVPWIEVDDANHKKIVSFSLFDFGSGHGWGPFEVKRGEMNSTSYLLPHTTQDDNKPATPLFSKAGVYFLRAKWGPPVLIGRGNKRNEPQDGKSLGKTYAVAESAPVMISILPSQ